jgi:hypothetical protein
MYPKQSSCGRSRRFERSRRVGRIETVVLTSAPVLRRCFGQAGGWPAFCCSHLCALNWSLKCFSPAARKSALQANLHLAATGNFLHRLEEVGRAEIVAHGLHWSLVEPRFHDIGDDEALSDLQTATNKTRAYANGSVCL